MIYKCTKSFAMKNGEIAFTEGKLYEGHKSATPSGEWAMSFVDDTGTEHLMMGRSLWDHLQLVDTALHLKPDGCTCQYPEIIVRNMNGHSEDCPVYIEWHKRVYGE